MFELDGEQYTLEQVTAAAEQSNMSLDEYLKEYNIKKLEETVEPVEKLKDVAVKDATTTSSPGQASESMDSKLEDTFLEYQEPSKRDLLVFNIKETEKQIQNYIKKGGEVNESDAAVLQGYKDELAKIDNQEDDIPNLLEHYIGVTTKSITNFAAGFERIKDANKFSLMEAGIKAFMPESFYEGTAEQKRALMKAAKMDIGIGMGGIVDQSKALENYMSSLEPMIRQYENESMVDDIAEGNYLLAGERAIGAALESLPSVAMAALGPGGFVALGLSSAGNKFEEEFKKDPTLNTSLLLANAFGSGAIEAGFELFTRGVLKRAGLLSSSGNKQAALDLIRGGAESLVKKLGINIASESGSEMATEITSMLFDAATLPDAELGDIGKNWKQIVEAGIVGSVFATTATTAGAVKNTNTKTVKAAEYILMPDKVKQVVVESSNNISKLFKDKALADPEGSALIDEAIENEVLKVEILKAKNSEALQNMTPEEIKEYANNKTEINKLNEEIKKPDQLESVKKIAEEKLKTLQDTNKELFKESVSRKVEKSVEFAKKAAKVYDVEINSDLTVDQIREQFGEEEASSDGWYDPKTNTIYINKDVAKQTGAVTVGSHEILHRVIRDKIKKEGGADVVKEFMSLLSKEQNQAVERRIKALDSEGNRLYSEEYLQKNPDEYLTIFSDAILKNEIKYNENIFTKIGDIITPILRAIGFSKIKFNTGKDVYNFMREYSKSVKSGKISKDIIKATAGKAKDIDVEKVFSKNKELGNEIKALVPEGTTKRRYDSRIIGDVYAKLVQGNTLDGLINGQLNKFGVVGDNVYGKPKDIFLEDVKAQLYEKSLTRFNPETNDDLGGFVVNELIRYRIGDVVNKYKKEAGVSGKSLDVAAGEVGSVQEIADDTVSIEEQIDLADTETRSKTKLIKATKILSKEQYDKAAEIVKEKVKNIDPKNLSYKKVSGFVTDIVSKVIGVPAGKITDPKKNLSKGETTAGAMFIENNIDYIRKTLPKGAVTEAATEKLIGTATGVPNSVLKLLYDKNPRIKKGAGLSPWTLKKGLTNQDILDAIGRPKRADDKRIQIDPRSPEGQIIKGILSIVDKNIANELVRTVDSDLTLEQKQDVAAGKSATMFSKSFNLGLENGSNVDNIASVLFSKSARKKYEQVLKAKRPELKDIPEQVDSLIKWADSLDIRDDKKAKYKKLGLFYMANGYAIFPEDGYKVTESIRLAAINKIDPYSFKNPNELIEKYEKTTKIAKINPDSVSEFSNKEEIAGYTIYDVEDSKKGQEAVRKIVDSNWGKKSNPWCLVARGESGYLAHDEAYSEQEIKDITAREEALGNTVELESEYMYEGRKVYELIISAPKEAGDLAGSFNLWKGYNKEGNGFKIAFNNGKLNSFRDGNDMQWWDRMDKPQKGPALKIKADTKGLVAEGYIDLKNGAEVIEGYKKDYKKGDLTIEESYTKDKKLVEKYTFGKNNFSDKSLIAEYSFQELDGNDYIETESKYEQDNSEIINTTRKFDSQNLHKKTLRKRYYDKNRNIIDEVREKDILTGVITEEIIFTDNNTGLGTFDVYKAETINGKKNVSIDERKRFIFSDNPFSFSKGLSIEKSLIQEFISQKPSKVSARKQNSYARIIKELLEYGGVSGVESFERAIELGNYTKDELDLINFVFEGRDWLFGIFQDEKTLNQGLKLEKLVKVAIKKLGLKDVSLDLSEGGFSSGVDIVLSVKDKKLNIELKLNEKARVGSFTIKRNGDVFSYTKGVEGIETKLPALHKAIQEQLKGDKYQKAWKKYTEEGVKIGKELLESGKVDIETYVNEETGQLVGPKEVFDYLKDPKKGNYQKDLTIKINQIDGKPIDQKIIELLYNNKGVSDINFGGVGMFALGESISGRPELDANVEVRIVTSRANSNGIYRSIQRATPFILDINNTTDLDLADLSKVQPNIEELVESMSDKSSDKSFSKGSNLDKASSLDKAFNDILENKSGIDSKKRYGIVEAITKGSSKGRFNFFIPPSAEDFVGLLYPTLGKGKVGDAQMSWYKKNLIDPYAEAMNKISKARVYMMNTYNSLKKQLDVVPKDLAKKIKGTDYTREQALRVYIWNKQKMNIPGISDADISKLTSYIADDANLQTFGDQLINMQMGDGYVKPKEGWPAGTITTDILEGLNTTKRAKYLKSWQENVDAVFSEENLNKLQAIYGLNYRKALENMLKRMKTGRNRSFPGDSATGRFTDWLTGSVGTIMFLNTRSAVLQTISAINFVNFTDNNILAAGKAFANQKQYWTDFTKLINSDFLKERRGGLRINVNEADIADMAKKGGVKGAISKLLELGFAPTQIADSFAIASGGATFYRNRINTYLKEGGKFEKPQVIFLTGAAGSGKTTVAKNFGKNWAIVNKDVEMEALMKKAGLPSDLNKLTREQGDKWRKIQSKASENALDKIKKLKEQGKNIIIDDTGSSEATLSMLKRELEKSGYESKMLLLGTSLEQSLKRNKDRKQRTLTDVTVKNSFEALMNNKKRYKEIFKDGFIEATGGKISDNLINELTGKMSQKQAEKKAFEDFRETAEESQQSSRPDRISQQQASPLGRVILAFANTPIQYARIIKKAASDLKNGRGDAKTNISKIIYYGVAQNLIFNALQQALFAIAFDDEEPEDKEKEKKNISIANGMLDSILRGSGIGGSVVSVGKNAIIKLVKELDKDRPKLQNIAAEVLKISPPVSAKYSRLVQAGKSYDWNKQEMKEKGLSLDNPAFLAGGNVLSALTNIPLDRAIKKANNVVQATSQDLETWERIALLGGWQAWELGIKEEKKKKKKKPKSKIQVSKIKVRR